MRTRRESIFAVVTTLAVAIMASTSAIRSANFSSFIVAIVVIPLVTPPPIREVTFRGLRAAIGSGWVSFHVLSVE